MGVRGERYVGQWNRESAGWLSMLDSDDLRSKTDLTTSFHRGQERGFLRLQLMTLALTACAAAFATAALALVVLLPATFEA